MKTCRSLLAGGATPALLAIIASLRGARADNPIVQDIYTADPAPVVYDGRVYVFTGHDEDGSTTYDMRDWRVFSSGDMANWQHHESPMSLETFSWASANAWAGQVIERNDKFYYYVPMTRSGGSMAIGVGVSDSITGPYKDAIGAPLLENGEIDPTVFIDDDGQAYMYWGNPGLWYVKLNEDMISYSGEITSVDLTVAGFGTREGESTRNTSFEEGPWIYKRNGLYYLVYAANCCAEDIRYSTGPSATGPWTYGGIIMEAQGASFTNHPGIVDFNGTSYFFYHNGALPGGGGFTRSVAVESFTYNSDGSIPLMTMTTDGPSQVASLNPYLRQEAETIAWSSGIETETCSQGGLNVCEAHDGDYIKVKGVDFGSTGAALYTASVASASAGGTLELRLDGTDGALIGTCSAPNTGGWQAWINVTCPVTDAVGTHDLYLVFLGEGTDPLFNVDWWQFS
ncbi:hypothetical protein KJ359_003149 [Pestalotiopsis sp. 9143b]|nr:hypothetical protein KJ359_003149 [Pestalotiopsis sp. 9143b]